MENETEIDNETIGFDISASFFVPLPWDVLVSVSNSCLKGYAPGFVEHESIKEKELPASYVFRLWQRDLGELGTVEIRKLGANASEINISGVPMNSVDTSPMWLAIKPEWEKKINDALKGRRRLQKDDSDFNAYLEVSNKADKAKAKIKARQKNHQADVVKAYFNRLLYELNMWTSNKVVPPPYLIALGGLSEWPDTRMMSQEAREYFEKYKLEVGKSATQQINEDKAEKPKQKGRYRLTQDEIKRRKKIVKDAERIFRESNPKKTWKQIAYELDIPERTLRDWRHNPHIN